MTLKLFISGKKDARIQRETSSIMTYTTFEGHKDSDVSFMAIRVSPIYVYMLLIHVYKSCYVYIYIYRYIYNDFWERLIDDPVVHKFCTYNSLTHMHTHVRVIGISQAWFIIMSINPSLPLYIHVWHVHVHVWVENAAPISRLSEMTWSGWKLRSCKSREINFESFLILRWIRKTIFLD